MEWLDAPEGEDLLSMVWPTADGSPEHVVFRRSSDQLWVLAGVDADDLRGWPVAEAPRATNDPLESLDLLYAVHPVLVHGAEALDLTRAALRSHPPLEVAHLAARIGATPSACLALSRALEDRADPEAIGALAIRLLGIEHRLQAASGVEAEAPFSDETNLPALGRTHDPSARQQRGRDYRNAFVVELLERLIVWGRTVTEASLQTGFQPRDPWTSGLEALRAGAAAGLRSSDRERRIRALANLATATITAEEWARREELRRIRREAAAAFAERAGRTRREQNTRSGVPGWLPWVVGLVVAVAVLRMLFG